MTEPTTRGRAWRRAVLPALLTLVALVAAAFAGSAGLGLLRLRTGEATAAQALIVARSYAAQLLSYDYRTIDADLARARALATGQLSQRYRELARTLVPRVRQEQTVQQAVVVGAGVESVTAREVRVLVLVNLITTRAASTPGGTREYGVQHSRVRLVLVIEGDRWRVSRLSTLRGDTPAR